MIGKYLTRGSSVDQRAIVQKIHGNTDDKPAANHNEVVAAVNYAISPLSNIKYTFTELGTILGFSSHVNLLKAASNGINGGYPIEMRMKLVNNDDGHVVVCDGYRSEGGVNSLHIIDPWYNSNDIEYGVKHGIRPHSGCSTIKNFSRRIMMKS